MWSGCRGCAPRCRPWRTPRASSTSAAVPLALSFAPVVRARVVTMGNDDDRCRRRVPGSRPLEVAELDLAETRDVLGPDVLLDREPVLPSFSLEPPSRGAVSVERARDAPGWSRVSSRVELRARGAVEGRRQRGRGERPGPRDRERRGSRADRRATSATFRTSLVSIGRSTEPRRGLRRWRTRAGGLHAGGYSTARAGERVLATSTVLNDDAELRHPTILLVDDEDSIQTLLTYPLERDGYRVVQARDGEEALARFAEERVRPRRARHHAAARGRARGLPPPPRARAPCRSSCSRPATTSSTRCSGSSSARTTTSRSRSRSASSAARVRALLRRAATPHQAGRREEVIERGDAPHRRSAAHGRGARRPGRS